MPSQGNTWLLSLVVTAALMVASLTLFMDKQPVRATHPNHVAAVLEGRADKGAPMTGVDGHGGLMVPHAADAHTELQEARSQIEQQADELEVAALTEARLTAALREVERKFAALKQKDVNSNDRRLPPPPPPVPAPAPALDKLQGTVAVGAGGGVGPAAGWFPKDAVFAPPSPKIRDEDGWEFDERKVKVTYVRMRL